MKKLNKLFAILIAVLGVGSLSAQTDVTDQYLTNAGFDDGTNGWTYGGNGTHYGGVAAYGSSTAYNSVTNVSVDKFGKSEGNALHTSAGWGSPSIYTQEVTLSAGEYKITFDVINRNSSATKITNRFGWVPNSGNAVYSSATDIIFNMWQTISVTFTLSTQTTGKISVGMVSTSGSGSGAVAKLFTDNVRIFKMDEASNPTIANPIDYSDLINQSTWWYDEDDNEPGSVSSLTTNVTKGEWPYRMAERYRGVGGHYGKKLYQTISVPAGVYQVQAACMSAHANGVEGGNALADGTLNNAYFYANDAEVTYPLANATSSFQKNIVTLTEDGTIEFGVKTVAVGANWNAIGCATVIKVANSYEEYLEDLLGESYTERQTLIGKLEALQSKLPEPYYNNTVSPAIASANEANTQETLSAANNILKGILTNAESMVEPYAKLTSLINLCTEYTDPQNSNANSDDVLNTFNTAISTATTAANAATTSDALNTAYNTLESARQTYAQNAVPVYPYPFDMTFLLPNTTFDSNTDGWTKTGGANWMDAGRNVECYNTIFEFSMEYEGLNSGSWEIQVDAFYRYGGYNDAETAHNNGTEQLYAILYANNNEVAVKSIMEGANKAGSGTTTAGGVHIPNGPGDCDAYFATGCYTNAIATVIADGKLKVGIKKEETKQYDWTIFDNFKLIYKGIDVTDLQNALSALITTADAIKDEKMGTAESATLSTALDNADATVTNADHLSEMISNLQSAYDNAVVSISTYAAVPAYIAKANSIHTSIAASYQAQYDNGTIEGNAETVRQALNVATFNYVRKEFQNEIVLENWGAASNAMWSASGEHWDGTTGEGCTSYYDANGTNTTHTLSKTVELTPGTYIFRAAGRAHPNTTLSLSVDIDGVEPVVFKAKDNQGTGITKSGNACFSVDSTYANDNKGRGWEWEFIKFTLSKEATVTLTGTCQSTGWGWASFANNGLWMDDATYVVANAGAITAPLAEAKALVNTKPMGATENAELTSAIALGEGTISTPAQLNAAIDALKEAVSNAKAWVAAYNEAKVPLVEALERFEADYNDGANGALRPMSDEAWSILLTAVETAAKAKDVTDSYASFATDAETFNKVMDDAEPSIILYKKWAGLITSVQAYYDNIKQDAALSTAISTASAESSKATDASLTSATEALNAAYQEALDGDFDASIFLGDNLDFESGTGTALDKLVFEIPGWDIEYNGNVNENARIQPETYGESNAIRIRSNWEDTPTTMRVYKEVVLPSGSYNLSMTLLTSITGSGVNLTYYELNGERTMLSSDTYKKVTAPSIELEEPTILLLSLGLTGTTGNNAQELYADSIALACNAKTLYQRTLEGIKALAEDGEPTLVITNVYNEYKDKEGSLTAEQKTTAIAVMNNAIVIDAANDVVTSLIKNADFTGGTNSYNVQGSGGQVQAPKEWTFGYTFEGWNDTYVTEGFFNLWAGVIKYGELSQVIKDLPNGTYRLTADMVTSSTDGSSITAIYGAPTNGNIARSKNADNSSDYVNYEVYFKVVDNQATIGARTDNHYFKLKNIQLEYVEDDAIAVDNGILYQEAFINRGNTTWDITEIAPNASEASIYMSSPNALIIANEGQVSNANNVIVDGTAASLVLNDGGYAFNTTADFTATALNYAREFTKDTWLTVCLPFAYPIPENVKVETLGAIDLDTKTFTFDEVTGTMEANTPYLIKNSTETAALFASFSNVEVEATPAAMNVTITADNSEHQGEFIGTYTTVKTDALMEDGTYDILFFGTDGQLYYLSQGITTKVVNIKPFRAYIRLPKDAINWSDGQQARVRHRNSEMTDIEPSTLNAQPSTEVYDLMGRKVNTMEKGNMYIVNGRKVVIR